MVAIYHYDTMKIFDGLTREITDMEGAPIGWTFDEPPTVPEGKFACFVGPGWQVIDEYPVNVYGEILNKTFTDTTTDVEVI
jgi:predicted AlkP superfamily phosphohydrolase/phosphomutase